MDSTGTAALVAEILGKRTTVVLDIGSRWGANSAWWRLNGVASLIGFDPDERECARLNAASPGATEERHIAIALGAAAGIQRFFGTQDPSCSSLFPPIEELINRYPSLSDLRLKSESSIRLTTLDAWAQSEAISEIAFMKLDTQGSELEILLGGRQLLGSCLGLEVEVEFSALYAGQCLFADVDTFLRGQGFVLWRLSLLSHCGEFNRNRVTGKEHAYYAGLEAAFHSGSGRLFWGNAVYLRDYPDVVTNPAGFRRGLVLAALLAGLGDYSAASCCLSQLSARWPIEAGLWQQTLAKHAAMLVTSGEPGFKAFVERGSRWLRYQLWKRHMQPS